MPLLKKPTSSLMVRGLQDSISKYNQLLIALCLYYGILCYPYPISLSSDVLHECRLLNNRAIHVISQTERSMSLKKQPKQFAIWTGLICVQHFATFCCMVYPRLMYCRFLKLLSYIQMLDNYHCHTHMLCVAVWGICWILLHPMHWVSDDTCKWLKTFILTDIPQFGSKMSLLAQCAFCTML